MAVEARRRAKRFPFSSEQRKLLITMAETLEYLEQKQREKILDEIHHTQLGLEGVLEFLEEKGVPLTPEQKAVLGIDNAHE